MTDTDVAPLARARKTLLQRFSVAALLIVTAISLISTVSTEIGLYRSRIARDEIAQYDRWFAEMIPFLPPRGQVSLMLPPTFASTGSTSLVLTVAQFSLAPRLIVWEPVDSEFLILPTDFQLDAAVRDPQQYRQVRAFGGRFVLFQRIGS
jgi:hypothetical protein